MVFNTNANKYFKKDKSCFPPVQQLVNSPFPPLTIPVAVPAEKKCYQCRIMQILHFAFCIAKDQLKFMLDHVTCRLCIPVLHTFILPGYFALCASFQL